MKNASQITQIATKPASMFFQLKNLVKSTNNVAKDETMQQRINLLKQEPRYQEILEKAKKDSSKDIQALEKALNKTQESYKNYSVY